MRILVVTWAWPPIGRMGIMRPMGMAREWKKRGHEIHILTGPGDRGGEYSPDLIGRARDLCVEVHRAPAPGIPKLAQLDSWRAVPSEIRPISAVRQILGQWKGFPDLQRSWIHAAIEVVLTAHKKTPFDVVWTTSPPESVHFIGRRMALAGIPWVADFRDPWSDYFLARWDPISRMAIDAISRWLLKHASAITAASEGIAGSIGRGSGRRVNCIRNGFDPCEITPTSILERTLGYFGRLEPRAQRPDRLWEGMRLARKAGHRWHVEFHLTAGGSGGATVVPPPDMSEDVKVTGTIPYDESLRRMSALTALMVLVLESRAGDQIVPGKLYEYVGIGRPVLVCAPQGYEARRLVEETGTGVGAWTDVEIYQAMERLQRFEIDVNGRKGLSREAAAGAAEEILRMAADGVG